MKELKKKQRTNEIVKGLRKASTERKEAIWKDLAVRLSKPSRQRTVTNVDKLAEMAEKNKGKTLVVPGKVLGRGLMEVNADISALAFSEKALVKIKGKALSFEELIDSKKKASEIVIVK